MTTYYRPLVQNGPARPDNAVALAGGASWFTQVECLSRENPPEIKSLADVPGGVLAPLTAARAPVAGLSMDRPRLMGILNVTPDSFSDGGAHDGVGPGIARALEMAREGADLVDIGGESTRPGAAEVPVDQEIARVAPVIRGLSEGARDLPISLDTRKSEVAAAGVAAGAAILNDVSGLWFDPDLARVAAETGAPLILMHSIGTPDTMQAEAEAAYGNVVLDVYDGLAAAVAQAVAAGVARNRIIVDPGIGFGKTQAQNLALISRVSLFHGLGVPILLGVSRKGFIGAVGQQPDAARRGPGSAGIGLWALGQGVQILRVHDIEMHAQAIRLWRAVAQCGQE